MMIHRILGTCKALILRSPLAPALLVLASSLAGTALAQDQVRDITQPQVTLRTAGHHAPVKSILFVDPRGDRLLSAGQDRIINDWKLDGVRGFAELVRTIRPPVWRGYRGAINTIALSPQAVVDGEKILAVAGYGIEANRGNIVLYRYPGLEEVETGQVIGHLTSGDGKSGVNGEAPKIWGHGDTVTCLAFDPRGKYLLSGSLDKTIKLWIVDGLKPGIAPNSRPAATFQTAAPIHSIAFSADGSRLFAATGEGQGAVLIYDTTQYVVNQKPMREIPLSKEGIAINGMAVSGDGRWVVVGREDGVLAKIDVATPQPAISVLIDARANGSGAIEAVALSPDSRHLAVSYVLRKKFGDSAELPSTECRVEIRDFLDNAVAVKGRMTLPNFAFALAFSPDSRRLVAVGGDTQKFYLFDVNNPLQPRFDWAGKGRSVRDVGFTADGSTLAISRKPRTSLVATDTYEGFHLRDRSQQPLSPASVVHRDISTYNGWTVQPIGPLELELKSNAKTHRLKLNPANLRWWSYTFIPPDGEQKFRAKPLLAVGTGMAITLYDVETGQPTRVFSGHFGPAYTMAPSPDGKFLASGSGDQTVRLWSLVGADRLPRLGATFEPGPAGRLIVKSVENLGHAEGMGLVPGDEITHMWVDNKPIANVDFLRQPDARPPDVPVRLQIRRPFELFGWEIFGPDSAFQLGSTLRDSPALTFFLSVDGDWALWSPRGYYDSSAAGDLDFLGWHLNNQRSIFQPRPTEFRRMSDFEKKLRQPRQMPGGRIDQILETGDPSRVFLADLPRDDPGEMVRSAAESLPWFVSARDREIALRNLAPKEPLKPKHYPFPPEAKPTVLIASQLPEGGGKVTIAINGVSKGLLDPTRAGPDGRVEASLTLVPGTNIVARTVELPNGVRHTETVFIDGVPSSGDPELEGKLWLVTMAPTFGDKAMPEFRYAAKDARDLKSFFQKHLVTRKGKPFPSPEFLPPLDGTPKAIRDELERLSARDFGLEDLLVVVIETHMLRPGNSKGGRLATSESRLVAGEVGPTIDVADLDKALASVSRKCRVLVFIDAQAENTPKPTADIDAWARNVCTQYGITVLSASSNGPSRVIDRDGQRLFTQEVLKMPKITSSLARSETGVFSLEEFGTQLKVNTRAASRRVQQAEFYRSELIDPKTPLFVPSPTMNAAEVPGNLRVAR